MLDLAREKQIIEILKQKNACSIYDLAQALYVSESTVRRDLARMERKGLITRIYGGAMLKPSTSMDDTSFFMRESENLQEKRSLAKAALSYVRSGMTIFLDSSTTTLQIVTMLSAFDNLLIVTNGLFSANEVTTKTNHRAMIVGGAIEKSTNSALGTYADTMVSTLHAQLAILSTSGFDPEFGFSQQSEDQATIKRLMIKNAEKVIFLVSKSKVGKKTLAHTCDIKDADVVITDCELPEAYLAAAPETEFINIAKQ
jgi:DeoR/GlpR family transcriptional regulator of sugar metabolism